MTDKCGIKKDRGKRERESERARARARESDAGVKGRVRREGRRWGVERPKERPKREKEEVGGGNQTVKTEFTKSFLQ